LKGRGSGRNEKIDGDALLADFLAQIARLDAVLADLHRGDVGAYGADIIGDGFSEQGARIICVPDDRGVG
jgi:hypothetical protein